MEAGIKKNAKCILKGMCISIIFTLIFLLIYSIILTYTDISEQWTSPIIIVLTAISILIGSSISNIQLRKNGIINGVIISVAYFLTIYFISSLITRNFQINTQMLITIGIGIIFGIIGGILGVNKK